MQLSTRSLLALIPALAAAQTCTNTANFAYTTDAGQFKSDFCTWLASPAATPLKTLKRKERYCLRSNPHPEVREKCALACYREDVNFEYPALYVEGQLYNCPFLTKSSDPAKNIARQERYCTDDGQIVNCGVSCNMCSAVVTTPAPTQAPTKSPTPAPTASPIGTWPTATPSRPPSPMPSPFPTLKPTSTPSDAPSMVPSDAPSDSPSKIPSDEPSMLPSMEPSDSPSMVPSDVPSDSPSMVPSDEPSFVPSMEPSDQPSLLPSKEPSRSPSSVPSDQPSQVPSKEPSRAPSGNPTSSIKPSPTPTSSPIGPTPAPTRAPTAAPTPTPTPPTPPTSTCVDDSTHTFTAPFNTLDPIQDCDYIASKLCARGEKYCETSSEKLISNERPSCCATCAAYDSECGIPCSDDAGTPITLKWDATGSTKKECSWLTGKNKETRQGKYCLGDGSFYDVSDSCCASCSA
ncbi:hypothetical protein CTEN210_02507 [Chaetoceros tenuissimus]|uniref:Uncharacterized protein n=1 Tax=Chaetoceros tenuissimus TaxID=426638 RepID=A0AAD3CI36_9STRA|nr:hypothetical protein CTEN210_02507 [Chaetoceros tenuissimus]